MFERIKEDVGCVFERDPAARTGFEVLTLYPGMETQVCPELIPALERGLAATINDNSRYLLLEFPPFSMPPHSLEFIYKLQLQGITPVIAHPERHLILQKDLNQLYDLVRQGALCQLTALSITGHLGSYVQKSAEQMIQTVELSGLSDGLYLLELRNQRNGSLYYRTKFFHY